MLPALAYTSEPLKVTTSGGTMTTFDGAGVTVGPPSPLPFPVPLVLVNGTLPWSRLSVMNATTSRPTIDRMGATQWPAAPRVIGARGDRGGALSGHDAVPASRVASRAARTAAVRG